MKPLEARVPVDVAPERAYERRPHGFTLHWGRVLTCEVPSGSCSRGR
jgi:hypothetical protein